MKNIELQNAISDVEIIKQIINREEKDGRLVGITLKSNIVLLAIASFIAVLLCTLEVISKGSMTTTLLAAPHASELKVFGIGFMAMILITLSALLYFILWRAAKYNNEEYQDYIARNFIYFKSTSLMSDLLMKFIAIALLVLANKPEWIALMLTAFIGDYLLQGRFFTLPNKTSMVLGLICFSITLAMFIKTNANLLIPLAVFSVVSISSLVRLLAKQQQLANPTETV